VCDLVGLALDESFVDVNREHLGTAADQFQGQRGPEPPETEDHDAAVA
jgi:hypothetical protein